MIRELLKRIAAYLEREGELVVSAFYGERVARPDVQTTTEQSEYITVITWWEER